MDFNLAHQQTYWWILVSNGNWPNDGFIPYLPAEKKTWLFPWHFTRLSFGWWGGCPDNALRSLCFVHRLSTGAWAPFSSCLWGLLSGYICTIRSSHIGIGRIVWYISHCPSISWSWIITAFVESGHLEERDCRSGSRNYPFTLSGSSKCFIA